MSLITPFPDFFDSAAPDDAMLNDAAKAIMLQIGGSYYDESSGTYKEALGNLNSTNNIVASPGFRNPQKAEPYSLFSLASYVPGTGANGVMGGEFIFGPFSHDCFLWMIAFTSVGASGVGVVNGGSYDIYVNNYKMYTGFTIDARSEAESIGTVLASISKLGMHIRAGDWISLDGRALTVATPYPVASEMHVATMYLQTLHVRAV